MLPSMFWPVLFYQAVTLVLGFLVYRLAFIVTRSLGRGWNGTEAVEVRYFNVGILALLTGAAMATVVFSSEAVGLAGTELLYYLVLAAMGFVSSRWCRVRPQGAVFLSVGLLLASAVVQVIIFLRNPNAQGQYGPEIVIFALADSSRILANLPLDAAVAFLGWRIAELTFGRRPATLPNNGLPTVSAVGQDGSKAQKD
jgi:uncharacterized membrane protein HdeD (DUF308 family)